MPQIRVPKTFFIKERKQAYGDWRLAFWRELLQNSVDAGATRIDADLETLHLPHPHAGKLAVTFTDNGPGMSREVLEGVYMALGETTKSDGSVGGFGRARILACFSQEHWQLRSRDWLATADATGSGYDVEDGLEHFPGMMVRVVLDDEAAAWEGDLSIKWRSALERYLSTCHLPDHQVWLNGLEKLMPPRRPGRFLREVLEGANLHEVDGEPLEGYLLVQVNGLAMFTEYFGGEVSYVLDLAPEVSRQYLTAGRDHLKPELRTPVGDIFEKLNRGRATAVMPPLPPIMLRHTTPSGHRVRHPGVLNLADVELHVDNKPTLSGGLARDHMNTGVRDARWSINLEETLEVRVSDTLTHDAVLAIDTNSEVLRAAAMAWDPGSWTGARATVAGVTASSWAKQDAPKAALLAAWTAACDAALDIIATLTGRSISYVPGFIVQEGVAARCRWDDANGVYLMMINPLVRAGGGDEDETAFIRFRRTPDSVRKLVAGAIHEACHVVSSEHDVLFASTLTTALEVMNQADIIKEVAKAWRG